MKKFGTIALLSLALVGSAFTQNRATPFGFKAGWSREEVVPAVGKSHIQMEKDSTVSFDTSPGPTNGFERFTIAVSSKGLAKVLAAVDVPTNRSGEQVREKYDAVKSALIGKYGAPKHDFDFLHVGALFSEPEDFTLSLVKEERTLTSSWELADGTFIILVAKGSSSQEAKIWLNYEFHPEFDSYVADRKKKEQSAY
jgi:hypothetical protein